MRKIKIATLVILCIITAGLCGILAYGMAGHDIYVRDYDSISYGSPHLVLEKEVPLDGIDSISVQYDMNSNDIYIYEGEGDSLTVREYNEFELTEEEVSTVKVTGSSLEIKGKKRRGRNYISFHFFRVGPVGGYTEIELPSSYKGALSLSTSSGDIDSRMDISLEKDFNAAASSGDINIPNIDVPNVSLSCSSGEVQVETISTASSSNGKISIATSSGDIDVKQLTGKIRIGSSSGDITVGQLMGETNIESSSGYVQSESISGDAQISTTSGDITVGRIDGTATVGASSGTVRIYEGSGARTVKTTSGDILLENVDSVWNVEASSGAIRIKASKGCGGIHSTSGDIDLDLGELTGNLSINSSSGYARIRLSPDNAFEFEANTSSGDIDTFFDGDLSFSKKGNNAHGTYGNNTKGNSIRIATTSGNVQVMD